MGKFFKLAQIKLDDMPLDQKKAIADKGLVDSIQAHPGTTSTRPDSIGFYKGTTVNNIIDRNINRLDADIVGNVNAKRLKNIARKLAWPKDPNFSHIPRVTNKKDVFKYTGVKPSLSKFVSQGKIDWEKKKLRDNIQNARKQWKYNYKNDIAYTPPKNDKPIPDIMGLSAAGVAAALGMKKKEEGMQ